MRTVAEAVVGASVVAVLYAIIQALAQSGTSDRVEWTSVSGQVFIVFVVAGVIIGAVRGWQAQHGVNWNNLGLILSIVSGLLLIAYFMWTAPVLNTEAPRASGVVSIFVGLGFLAAAFLSERSTMLSRALLGIGAVVLLVSAFLGGQLLAADQAWYVTGLSLLPALLAIVAAFTIGPVRRDATVDGPALRH